MQKQRFHEQIMRGVDSSLLGNGLWNREKQCESFTGSHELNLGLGFLESGEYQIFAFLMKMLTLTTPQELFYGPITPIWYTVLTLL